MTPWSKCKTSRSQHILAVSSRLRGMRVPTVREEQAAAAPVRPRLWSSGYDEHRRGASLPKTVAVPDFVDPVQLTNKIGPAVGTDGLQSGCHIASPRLPEAA